MAAAAGEAVTGKPQLIDLTHTLHTGIPSWDGDCGFRLEVEADYGDSDAAARFRTQRIASRAGMGTHLDAPAHCFAGAFTVESIPLEALIVPCVVIRPSTPLDEHAVVGCSDIEAFEACYGTIAPETFVIVCTGWGQHWSHPERYRNNLQFPSLHPDAADLLLSRGISGLGIDTLSPDAGGEHFPVHQIILGAGKYLVENVANADVLPLSGATALVMPIKLGGGTEAPVRLVAQVGGLTS